MSDTSYTPIHLESIESKASDGVTRKELRFGSAFSTLLSKIGRLPKPILWTEVCFFFQDSYHASGPLFRRIRHRVRSAQWRRILRYNGVQALLWTILVGWLMLTSYIGVTVSGDTGQYAGSGYGGCSPAGEFMAPLDGRFSNWDVRSTFQITVGFGHLTFSTAKFIDVAWDVTVGRGGQAFLVFIAYAVFTKSLMRFMENSPVSYGTFEALTFQTTSISSVFRLLRDFYTNATIRAKVAVFWIVLASLWVAAFPTFASAMSGYSPNIGEYITDHDQSLILWRDFQSIFYIIHDGWRIPELQGEHQVSIPGSSSVYNEYDPCDQYSTYRSSSYSDGSSNREKECLFVMAIANYTALNGGRPADTNSTFNNTGGAINLPPPTLNISAFYLPSSRLFLGTNISAMGLPGTGSTTDPKSIIWGHNNETYDLTYIKANGACQQQQTYKWGFSFLLLFIFCVIQTVWSFGMYVMYMDAYMESRFERAGRDMGTHRAALDFAKAIRKDMGEEATEELGDGELRRRVRRKLNGGVIQMEMLDHGALPVSRSEDLKIWWRMGGGWQGRLNEMRAWSFRKKFWVGFAVVCLLVVIIAPIASSRPSRGSYNLYD